MVGVKCQKFRKLNFVLPNDHASSLAIALFAVTATGWTLAIAAPSACAASAAALPKSLMAAPSLPCC